MRRLAFVAIAAAAGCGGGDAPPVCTGGWHVCTGQIRDADGRAVILRGINVSGGNKSAPYLASADEADLARLRDDWGMNAVRWVMPWAAVEPTEGAYDDAYLDAVRQRLDWAAAHGLLVISTCTRTSTARASASTARRAGPATRPATRRSGRASRGR